MSRKLDWENINGVIYGGLMLWGWYSILDPTNLIGQIAAILWGLFLGTIVYIEFTDMLDKHENQEEKDDGFKSLDEVELEIV